VSREQVAIAEGLQALPRLLDGAESQRILLVTGASGRHNASLTPLLAGFDISVFPGARQHVPEAVVEEARRALAALDADTVIALGGGSAIGLGKALRIDETFHFVAIPTTYSGSELTNLYGITSAGSKKTGRDPRVRPDAVIYDVALTLDMPRVLTTTSLMNALAHPLGVVGSGLAPGELREQAVGAIAIVYRALAALVRDPRDVRARADALRGAGLAARTLESGGVSLHHALVHRLGGRFDLDHSGLHSVLLPHSVHRMREQTPEIIAEIEHELAVSALDLSLYDLLTEAKAPVSLQGLGVSFDQLSEFLQANPELPRELVAAAFQGERPS
jgi:maleylacetate reductase